MADTEASIQLKLVTQAYMSAMRGLENQSKQSTKRMGSDFQRAMEAGAQGGISAVKDLFGTIKSGVGVVTGLLGGIGFGALVKGAIDSQSQFKNLSFAIQSGSGQLVKWQGLQKDVQATALKWGQQSDALGRSLGTMFSDTTDLEFAQAAIETVAITARGTGQDIHELSRVAGILNQKFGVTSEELPAAMAAVVSSLQRLGPDALQKLGDDFGEVGGKARTMGLQGTAAVETMLGFLVTAKAETGRFEQAMTALPQVFDQIIERTGGGVVRSAGRVPIEVAAVDAQGNKRSPADIIADIIAATGGDAVKLGEFGFGGEGLQTVMALAKGFQAELKATGGNVEAASKATSIALQQAAGSAIDFSEIQKRAAENVKGPAAGIDRATELLQQAFTKPEMMSAIEQLASNLPKLAEGIASLIDVVVENPLLAAGGVIGGTALRGGIGATLGPAIGQAFSTGGQTAAGSIEGAMTRGGSSAGKSIAGGFAGTAALTGAITAWTLALDQANKLANEQEDQAKDAQREREEGLANAERLGQRSFTRQVSLAERIFGKGKGTAEDIFGGGEEIVTRDPETGKVVTRRKTDLDREFEEKGAVAIPLATEVPTAAARRGLSPEDQARVAKGLRALGDDDDLSEQMLGGLMIGPQRPAEADEMGTGGGQGAEQLTAAVKSSGEETAQAIQQLPQQELRVRIVNPEDIKSGPTATTGTVTPGNQPRP